MPSSSLHVPSLRPMPSPTVGLLIVAAFVANLAMASALSSVLGSGALILLAAVVWSCPDRRTRRAAAALGLAVAIAGNLSLRASPWVTGPSLLAAATMIAIAADDVIVDPRRSLVLRTLIRTGANLMLSVLELARPVDRLLRRSGRSAAVWRGLALATTTVVVVGALLTSADPVFAAVVDASFDGAFWGHPLRTTACLVPMAAIAFLAFREPDIAVKPTAPSRHPVEGLMAAVALAGVLGLWTALQVAVALGGADGFFARQELTRADYLREGFFQLVAVAAVVIGLMRLLVRLIGVNDRRWRLLAVVIVAETMTLIATTFGRLSFYTDAYGLTMLRLAVAFFLGWLAIVLVIVGSTMLRVGPTDDWTGVAAAVSAAVMTLAFGWLNPAAFVAASNINGAGTEALDVGYLVGLGSDATSAIVDGLSERDPDAVAAHIEVTCAEGRAGLAWNRSLAAVC